MKLNFLVAVFGILSLPLLQASLMNQHYGESYHLTVCCTHLTGPRTRNSNCCRDHESDPWGICSSVCQVERLNLRAPLRQTTIRGTIPVKDNEYQVLNLTVEAAVRYINISVDMNWVARPKRKCTQRNLCEFEKCVKKDPDNATKCVADLIAFIQFQNEHFEDEATEVTQSIAAAAARTFNFLAADDVTKNKSPASVSTASSSPTTMFVTSSPTSESVKEEHIVTTSVNLKTTGVKTSSSEKRTTTTTAPIRNYVFETTSLEDGGLGSTVYTVNFVVGTVCGLMGGAVLTAIIVFLCWVRSGHRNSKRNCDLRSDAVQKPKISPVANPCYSVTVPDIIGMVSDTQQSCESLYAQIGSVDTLTTQDSSSDVISASYNTLGYTTTTTTPTHMYNRLDCFDNEDGVVSEGNLTRYDAMSRADVKSYTNVVMKELDGYDHCVIDSGHTNINYDTGNTSSSSLDNCSFTLNLNSYFCDTQNFSNTHFHNGQHFSGYANVTSSKTDRTDTNRSTADTNCRRDIQETEADGGLMMSRRDFCVERKRDRHSLCGGFWDQDTSGDYRNQHSSIENTVLYFVLERDDVTEV